MARFCCEASRVPASRFVFAFLVLSVLTTGALGAADSKCYFPAGDIPSDRFPCNATAEESVCCASGFYCLSNGLCQDYRYTEPLRLLRGSCTDENWNTSACPNFCLSEYPTDDEAVYYCGSGKYCCNDAGCCNSTTVNFLTLAEPKVTATITQTPSAATPSTFFPSSTHIVSAAANPSASTTSSSSPSSTSTSQKSSSGSSNAVAIGAGVGVGVGVVLIALAIGGICYWRRRRRRTRSGTRAMTPPPRYEAGGIETEEAPRRWWRGQGKRRQRRAELDATRPPVELPGRQLDKVEMASPAQ